ncbi:GGDEF domain-containing protein [Vibrio mytili]|uniref:diguanylate cyclase n=1 Tax=Vibrio mytili TaxID=50718 RepID=A0A0C3HRX9_9VIBR|nr:GGDEF domain-containing protein [Vibrio mytili]KIN10951.1 diguanylate cyclase [Vibrio mytili]
MSKIHKFIFSLSTCTILLVIFYYLFGDTRKLEITPDRFNFYATKDSDEGGVSEAEISIDQQSITLNCDIKKDQYAWPYCGISIYIDVVNATQGLDLSSYHTIRLKLRYEQAGDDEQKKALRLYLRNYNPEYSNPDDEYTIKYNGMQFSPSDFGEMIEIPIENLQVMTWWLADNKVAIEHSAPEFTNITRIDIATGASAPLGKHKIIFEKIELEGQYFSLETLLLWLVFVWMMLGLTFSLNELHRNRRAYANAMRRHRHLEKVNSSLREKNNEFAELAHRDAVTGAMNRHAVRNWLDEQSKHLRRKNDALSILYMDIDHFKTVNDTFGHQIGDDILREFVMVVAGALNTGDKLVRWGGEEFVVFCPSTNIEYAISQAEKIRKKVSAHIWVHGEILTCSIGVANLHNESVTESIARADEALYKAKRNGRNRIEVDFKVSGCDANRSK